MFLWMSYRMRGPRSGKPNIRLDGWEQPQTSSSIIVKLFKTSYEVGRRLQFRGRITINLFPQGTITHGSRVAFRATVMLHAWRFLDLSSCVWCCCRTHRVTKIILMVVHTNKLALIRTVRRSRHPATRERLMSSPGSARKCRVAQVKPKWLPLCTRNNSMDACSPPLHGVLYACPTTTHLSGVRVKEGEKTRVAGAQNEAQRCP